MNQNMSSKYATSAYVGDEIVQLCKDLGAKIHSDKEKGMIKELFRQGHRELASEEALLGSIFRIGQKVFHQQKRRVSQSDMEECVLWAVAITYEMLVKHYDPSRAEVSTFVDLVLNTIAKRGVANKVPYQGAIGSCPNLKPTNTDETNKKIKEWQQKQNSIVRLDSHTSRYNDEHSSDLVVAGETRAQQQVRCEYSSVVIARIRTLLGEWAASEAGGKFGTRNAQAWWHYRVLGVSGPDVMCANGFSRQRLSQVILQMDKVVRRLAWADTECLEALEIAIDYEMNE